MGAPDGLFPEGSLKSLPLDRAAGATVWDPVPGPQNLGGIWGWGGISVDPRDGSIFTAVGNSHVHSEIATASSTTRGTETTSFI